MTNEGAIYELCEARSILCRVYEKLEDPPGIFLTTAITLVNYAIERLEQKDETNDE